MSQTNIILLSLVGVLCLESAFAEGESQKIDSQNAQKIVNIGVMKGNIINNQYGVPQKAVDRLLKELDERGIKLQQREQAIAEWIQKYKDLEIQLAIRSDDTAKQAKAFLAEGNLEEAEKLFKQSLASKLNIVKEAAADAFALAQIKDLQYQTTDAIAYYQQSLQLNPDNADGWNRLGHLFKRIGELNNAIAAYQTVLKLGQAHQDQEKVAWAYGNLGVVYYTHRDLDKAIEFQQKALTLSEALGSKEGMTINYTNLGNVYFTRGDLDKAVEFYQKALTLSEALGSKEGIAGNYNNLGLVYYTRGDLDKTIEFHQKALTITESLGIKEGMAQNYGNLGNVYFIRSDLDKAVEFYQKALTLSEALGSKEEIALNYERLGLVYKQKGNKAEAKRYWQKSIELYKYIGSPMAKKVQGWLDALQ